MEIFDLAILLLGAKIGGAIFNKLNQPSLVGELLAGIVLGSSILGIVKPSSIVDATSQLGLMFLVLLTSLSIDWKKIENKVESLSIIELIMASLIFIATYLIGSIFNWNFYTKVVIALALVQSSLAIASRTLTNLGKLNSSEGETIIGLQIVDDIAAILNISILASFLKNSTIGAEPILKLLFIIIGFFVVVRGTVSKAVSWLIDALQKYGLEEVFLGVTLLFAFLLATFTEKLGMASFLGVFLAGIALSKTNQSGILLQKVKEIGEAFFIPIFFASIGLGINILSVYQQVYFVIPFIILIIAIKWISSSIPFMLFGYSSNESLKMGSGMISISEVALIILSMGLSAKVLDELMYSIMVVSFIVVNILSPMIMNLIFKTSELSCKRRKFYRKIFKMI